MNKSPLNYIGNKYQILEQLLPLFPKDIDIFINAFSIEEYVEYGKDY